MKAVHTHALKEETACEQPILPHVKSTKLDSAVKVPTAFHEHIQSLQLKIGRCLDPEGVHLCTWSWQTRPGDPSRVPSGTLSTCLLFC